MSGVSPLASATQPWRWANWVSQLPGPGKRRSDIIAASRAIIVHEPAHVRGALAAAASLGFEHLTLSSARGAAAYNGPLWFQNMVGREAALSPKIEVKAILDCGDRPGHALTALRFGLADISLTGKARDKVAAIAKKMKARLHNPALATSLDLIGADDPEAICRAWLGKQS